MSSDQHVVATEVRHRAVTARVEGTLRRVVEHHAPDPAEYKGGRRHCTGCDPSAGYQDESAAWPCSTFLLIEEGDA